jgi:hypothetical protein
MDAVTLTLLDEAERRLPARRRGDTFLIAPTELAAATGWELKPEGLCRGPVCVPTRARADLLVDGAVDLSVFAALLGRPLALEPEHAVAALGTAAADRGATMERLEAPDFTLPDLEGRPFTFSSLGKRKKLLVAWASW